MSRSGYSDDGDNWDLIRWRGAVSSATKGKRGQAFFKELLGALNAMPKKELISNDLEHMGRFCALGVIGHSRGVGMSDICPDEPIEVSEAFDIAPALAQEIVYMNDEDGPYYGKETPENRYKRMHKWVANQLINQ